MTCRVAAMATVLFSPVLTGCTRASAGADPLRPHAGHLAGRQAGRLQLPRRHLDRRGHRRRRPAGDHARGPRHQPGLQPRRPAHRLLLQPPRQLRRLRRPGPGRQAAAADLRLGDGPGQRLVARRQAGPVRLEPRDGSFPSSFELYTVARRGRARATADASAKGKKAPISPEGGRSPTSAGRARWYRKGYRGSSNDDIWICNADGTNNRQLTTFNGQDRLADVVARTARPSTTSASSMRHVRATSSARTPPAADNRRAGHVPQGRRRPPGPHQRATASGSSTSAAPTCGSLRPATASAPQARHRGPRRRQDQPRAR